MSPLTTPLYDTLLEDLTFIVTTGMTSTINIPQTVLDNPESDEAYKYTAMLYGLGSAVFLKQALTVGLASKFISPHKIEDCLAQTVAYTDAQLSEAINVCDNSLQNPKQNPNELIIFGTAVMCRVLLDSYHYSNANNNTFEKTPNLAKTLMGALNAVKALQTDPEFVHDGAEAFAHFTAAQELFSVDDSAAVISATYFAQNNPDIIMPYIKDNQDPMTQKTYNWAVNTYNQPK
jgi:hypothetical protein